MYVYTVHVTLNIFDSVLNPPPPSENGTAVDDVSPLLNAPGDIYHVNWVMSCHSEADEVELTPGDKGFM